MTRSEFLEIKDKITYILNEEQCLKVCSIMELFCDEQKMENLPDYIENFISSKKIEGCSLRTVVYYTQVLKTFSLKIKKSLCFVTSDDIRFYLSEYQNINSCSNVSLDNIRRILSSFYRWMEEEDFIIKSPMKRIHKVKSPKLVKTVFSDEEIEKIRNIAAFSERNTAFIDLLISSGVRVGELVNLNIQDINFDHRSCVVYGKGAKERIVYFDVKTKISLQKYLAKRHDKNPALFVTLRIYGKKRLQRRMRINTIENILRNYGKILKIEKTNPHKFRRTLATNAIDKGMPIEQVQVLLGHAKIDTTLNYSQVYQKNVMNSYQKYIA